jgi:hypothetical protein
MFLAVRTLVRAAQGNRNHAAYCVAAPGQRDREPIGTAVAGNLNLVHQASILPRFPLIATGLGELCRARI